MVDVGPKAEAYFKATVPKAEIAPKEPALLFLNILPWAWQASSIIKILNLLAILNNSCMLQTLP